MNDNAAVYELDRAARPKAWDKAAYQRAFRHDISIVDNRVRIRVAPDHAGAG